MKERIVKNKRVSKCSSCGGEITTSCKVAEEYDGYKRKDYHHLSCSYKLTLKQIAYHKRELSEEYKKKRKLKKYTKEMILENLGY